MHAEAFEWVSRYGTDDPVTVLDLGGRNVNGSIRALFPNSTFLVLDLLPDNGVDIVANAGSWTPTGEWDVVTATELFEHAENWPDIVGTAFKALKQGGLFIATMAGPGRRVHSGIDGGGTLHPGETYATVHPDDLTRALSETGFVDIEVEYLPVSYDTRCAARKP
jgi:hypothetical protein